MEMNMINIQVATCKAVMANEEKDVRSLLVSQFMLLGVGAVLAFFGQGWIATILVLMAAFMLYPLLDYYRRWSKRINALLASIENVAVNYDFE
jgi:uncharacterized membrane protein